MHDSFHATLVVVRSVSVVAQTYGNQMTINIYSGLRVILHMIFHNGGLEVVETRQRRREDPSNGAIGTADVGDHVIQD